MGLTVIKKIINQFYYCLKFWLDNGYLIQSMLDSNILRNSLQLRDSSLWICVFWVESLDVVEKFKCVFINSQIML